MKHVGFVARLVVIATVLALAAFVASGCGDDNNTAGNSGGSGSTASGNGDTSGDSSGDSNGGSKTYSSNEKVNKSGTVTVDSKEEMSADQQAVVNLVGTFGDAAESKDYEKICSLLTKEAQKIGEGCVKTFKQTGKALKDFNLTVKSVKVSEDGKSAKASVNVSSSDSPKPATQTLTLVKEDGDWKIQILGQ